MIATLSGEGGAYRHVHAKLYEWALESHHDPHMATDQRQLLMTVGR